jgi:16S rRNA (uracil1498-N3)-methyltransferase
MRKALCTSLPSKVGSSVEIPESEANHLVSVLRLKPGDTIEILDGQGKSAQAKLFYQNKSLYAELITEPVGLIDLQSHPLHLSMAVLKGEAMEWVIEKAVELGVRSLTPFQSEFSVVDLRKKGPEAFRERWQKIADQALKQCGRLSRMTVHSPISFENVLMKNTQLVWMDESLAYTREIEPWNLLYLPQVADEVLANPNLGEADLIIGPEGGFSPNEKNRLMQTSKKAIKRGHAGAAILRAETAALFGISVFVCKMKK